MTSESHLLRLRARPRAIGAVARDLGHAGSLALLALAACGPGPPEQLASRPDNLLLVTIDTLRADHCSPYGYEHDTTPTLARLADEGALFEQAYAPMATTGPSHATLFTGRHPLELGYYSNYYGLADQHETLAERLAGAGYHTAAVVSSLPLTSEHGFAQGFEHFDEAFDSERAERRGAREELEDGLAWHTTERALDWAGARAADPTRSERPWFLWVHYFDPHDPYQPPAGLEQRFRPRPAGERQRLVAAYDGEILYTDGQLDRLLAGLGELAMLERTLIVVTSDHGEGLMKHGYARHGAQLYEEAVRVPLVLHRQGLVPAALRVETPVALVDVLPTLEELLGLGPGASEPSPLRGRSLAALLDADPPAAAAERPLFFQRRRYDGESYAERKMSLDGLELDLSGELFAVRLGSWKYLEDSGPGTRELYDLLADPHERANLEAEHPDRARLLSEHLGRFRAHQVDPATAAIELDPEELEGLEQLGYVR